jgi:hypothetical protein
MDVVMPIDLAHVRAGCDLDLISICLDVHDAWMSECHLRTSARVIAVIGISAKQNPSICLNK